MLDIEWFAFVCTSSTIYNRTHFVMALVIILSSHYFLRDSSDSSVQNHLKSSVGIHNNISEMSRNCVVAGARPRLYCRRG